MVSAECILLSHHPKVKKIVSPTILSQGPLIYLLVNWAYTIFVLAALCSVMGAGLSLNQFHKETEELCFFPYELA